MNLDMRDAQKLTKEVIDVLQESLDVSIILAPPLTYLNIINTMCISFENISIAAQNCSSEQVGSFTGEVSADMIRSVGAEYVILGHSERRQYFSETNLLLQKKVNVALNNNLKVIFCCGENIDQRNNGIHLDWIRAQISDSLFHLDQKSFSNVIIAYEPIWAIGTGENASPIQAEEIHAFIRSIVSDKYGSESAEDLLIVYGGSCNPSNAKDIFTESNIDGGLVGGASLSANSFVEIIKSF